MIRNIELEPVKFKTSETGQMEINLAAIAVNASCTVTQAKAILKEMTVSDKNYNTSAIKQVKTQLVRLYDEILSDITALESRVVKNNKLDMQELIIENIKFDIITQKELDNIKRNIEKAVRKITAIKKHIDKITALVEKISPDDNLATAKSYADEHMEVYTNCIQSETADFMNKIDNCFKSYRTFAV